MPKATKSVKDAARRIVRRRDDDHCQMCGKPLWDGDKSVHHRLNRGRGGSALLERASILITACGDGVRGCHGLVTQNPAWAESIGWLLPRNNPDIDPEQERILTIHGWVLLTDSGERLPYTGEGAA
ncbi:hypothetical protein [Kribbella sp. NPDC050470]|uniref:hypothetical protein n=1 Tax=unclassified Kribbella TaxID=2644121 RepID=UPI00379CB937